MCSRPRTEESPERIAHPFLAATAATAVYKYIQDEEEARYDTLDTVPHTPFIATRYNVGLHWTLHSALCALRTALCVLRSALCALLRSTVPVHGIPNPP